MQIHQVRDRINDWLGRLGDPSAGLKLDDEGHCFLVADGAVGILLSCPRDSGMLVLASELLSVPIPLDPALYEEILALNLQVEATDGTQIFFDKNTRALGLLVAREAELLNESQFVSLLTRFQYKAIEFHQLLQALLWTTPGASPSVRIDANMSARRLPG